MAVMTTYAVFPFGVIAIWPGGLEAGLETVIGLPGVPVAVLIGVTVPEPSLLT